MELSIGSAIAPEYRQRILVVDDDDEVRQLLARKLDAVGFEVMTAESGDRALDLLAHKGLPHCAIVDINMPGMSGLDFCATIQEYVDLPVIVVTAVDETATTISALDLFAEDYIVKPFNLDELVVRVRRLLRRIGDFSYTLGPAVQIDQQLGVDFVQKQAVVNGEVVELTPIEAKLLYVLWRNMGRVVTIGFLLGRVWPGQQAYEETLRVHLHRLRQKIEGSPRSRQYIETVRGQGYRFVIAGKEGR